MLRNLKLRPLYIQGTAAIDSRFNQLVVFPYDGPVRPETCTRSLISGFHRALLQSITFISRLNALHYTKLRG